ncbi:hypothetical protein EB796_007269 [Bugula neritina]|uniref:Hcy-binding domain-containing protein n=1 Tax=Bugula neritina TaxID=10212 RepID=A0A7J7K711_BUGNE|nr:hypothetical protein EB796_007269 [Bugula neritina]
MCQAFTYYSHREKMKDIGRENEFETLNQRAHEIAKKVAEETGVLFCSGVGTTNVYDPNSPEKMQKCEELLREQIAFSAKYGVDYICIETLWDYGEASIALKVCKEFNIPAVITLAPVDFSGEMKTFDGYKLGDALKLLEDEGAACVGLNCARGPETIIPLIRDIRKQIKGPLACVCLGYKTTEEECTWYMLKHPRTGVKSFPMNLLAHCLGRSDLEWYAKELKDIGVNYVGMCCGNCPTYTRTIAMEFGRTPPAAKYVSDLEKNSMKGANRTTGDRYAALGEFMGMAI